MRGFMRFFDSFYFIFLLPVYGRGIPLARCDFLSPYTNKGKQIGGILTIESAIISRVCIRGPPIRPLHLHGVCSILWECLKYFIFVSVRYSYRFPFSPNFISFFSCAVALLRLASSLLFAVFRFASLRTRPFRFDASLPSRRARLRRFALFSPLPFLSLAAHTGVALGLDSASPRLRLGLERPR